MSRDIYNILNEVEIDLDDYYKEELSDIEKKKIKNNLKKTTKQKGKYKKAASAVAAVAIICTTLFGTNLGAAAYENVEQVLYKISNYLGIEKSLEDYTTVLNKSITKEGITIRLNEVILDGNELIVSTTTSSNEKIENGYVREGGKIYINGKSESYASGGSSREINENTVESVMSYALSTEDLSGDLNVKIVFSSVYVNEDTKKALGLLNSKLMEMN